MNEFIDEDLYEYLLKHSSEEPEHLKQLNKETHLKIQSDYFKNCKATIKQYCGDALEIIPTINETFDLIFLDADKENYINYYNLIIDKLRVGGLIIADNVLWSGKVLKKNSKDEATKSLIEFNKLIKNDDRVHNVIIPVRDGLNLIYKN